MKISISERSVGKSTSRYFDLVTKILEASKEGKVVVVELESSDFDFKLAAVSAHLHQRTRHTEEDYRVFHYRNVTAKDGQSNPKYELWATKRSQA